MDIYTHLYEYKYTHNIHSHTQQLISLGAYMELIASNSKQQIFNSATDVAVWFLLSALDFQLKMPGINGQYYSSQERDTAFEPFGFISYSFSSYAGKLPFKS